MGGARKRKAPLIEDCAVVPLPQDGDCFYKCIARAYASAGLSASDEANEIMLNDKENEVKRLRRCVSRRVDDGVFARRAICLVRTSLGAVFCDKCTKSFCRRFGKALDWR